MLVAESTRRSRLRVLYGILAQSALSQFDTPTPETYRSAYFRNLITLLEMYRYETLRQPSHRAVLDRREITKQDFLGEKHEAEAVEHALKAAHNTAYKGLSRDEMVDRLKSLFDRISANETLEPEEIRRAKLFLRSFTKALRN